MVVAGSSLAILSAGARIWAGNRAAAWDGRRRRARAGGGCGPMDTVVRRALKPGTAARGGAT
ncbi:unnamed protein product [Urochloa humidicola]